MNTELLTVELSNAHFEKISRRVYEICGINLQPGKEGLVKSRLVKRLRALNMDDFDKYLRYVEDDRSGHELSTMIDVLTTNKTSFFRESQHFAYLSRVIIPKLNASSSARIWSAGCSSGKEAYTIAMLLREAMPDIERRDVRILATDLSSRILAVAREAIYGEEVTDEVPPQLVQKYFTPVRSDGETGYRVNDNVKSLVRLARLNLMDKWPMTGSFDAIFCRNVMIYFDKPTQAELVRRFWQMLVPGGHLFIGHSESLTNISGEFRYVQPALYVK